MKRRPILHESVAKAVLFPNRKRRWDIDDYIFNEEDVQVMVDPSPAEHDAEFLKWLNTPEDELIGRSKK